MHHGPARQRSPGGPAPKFMYPISWPSPWNLEKSPFGPKDLPPLGHPSNVTRIVFYPGIQRTRKDGRRGRGRPGPAGGAQRAEASTQLPCPTPQLPENRSEEQRPLSPRASPIHVLLSVTASPPFSIENPPASSAAATPTASFSDLVTTKSLRPPPVRQSGSSPLSCMHRHGARPRRFCCGVFRSPVTSPARAPPLTSVLLAQGGAPATHLPGPLQFACGCLGAAAQSSLHL